MSNKKCYVMLKYETNSVLGSTEEPEDYILKTSFTVFGLPCDSAGNEEIYLGKGTLSRVQVGRAINDHQGLYFVFDASQEILNAGCTAYNSDFSDFKPSVLKQFPEAFWCDDFLLIEQLQLESRYRGQGVGLSIVHRIVQDWGDGCSLVVGKPHPLNTVKNTDSENKRGQDKLRKYWEKLGWERIGKSDHWGMCPAEQQKSSEEIGLSYTIKIDNSVSNQVAKNIISSPEID